jgi:Mce-associated membrane protein
MSKSHTPTETSDSDSDTAATGIQAESPDADSPEADSPTPSRAQRRADRVRERAEQAQRDADEAASRPPKPSLRVRLGRAGRAVAATPGAVADRARALTVRARRAVIATVATLVVLAVAWLCVTAVLVHGDRQRDSDVAAASDAARARVAQVLSFDARTLDADTARGREAVTGPFAGQYDQIVRSLLDTYGRQFGTTIRTQVQRSGVAETRTVPEGRQVVLTIYAQQAITGNNTAPRTAPAQLEVTMTQTAGQWLVSDMREV